MVDIVEATVEHAEQLAKALRVQDCLGISGLYGGKPLDAIVHSIACSMEAWTCFMDGEILGIFGVAPGSTLSGVGAFWMATSTLADKHRKTFWKVSTQALPVLRSRYPILRATIHADYDRSLAWAERLGFSIFPVHRNEITNEPFRLVQIGGS